MNANPQQQTSCQGRTLYIAFELSSSTWKLATADHVASRARIRNVPAGDLQAVELEIKRAKARFRLHPDAPVVSCYEAGRDGFWIHRCLVSLGIDSYVVEPASIQVNRRFRRAKTDRIDAEMLVNALIRRIGIGERKACQIVRVPDKDIEDARHTNRELKSLKYERTSHTNRIKSLLVANGCTEVDIDPNFPRWLERAVGGDGERLGRRLVERLQREFKRLQLVTEHIRELQKLQHEMLRQARKEVMRSEEAEADEQIPPQPSHSDPPHGEERIIALAERLTELDGIGAVTAFTLASEIFAWRDIQNRRQLAALVGLVPTPHSSGDEKKEQGISKAGRGELRILLIEIAWLWNQYQPQSELTRWYQERFGGGTSRDRKRGIVALARKLLVALGKFVKDGEVPAGATFSDKLSTNYTPSLLPKKTSSRSSRAAARPAAA